MQTQTTLSASPAAIGSRSILGRFGRNRLLLGGAALSLIAAGLAWQWGWLVAIGVAPLLIGAAPCAAMCALGLCVHRMCGRTGGADENRTSDTTSSQQEK